MPSNLQFQEIYSIVDFQSNYVSLLVCIYQNSQFHILFNEREFFSSKKKSLNSNIKICARFLKNLTKKAEKELDIKINEISYNLPSENIKILNHSYIQQFPTSVKIGLPELNKIYKGFSEFQDKNKDYKNCLFKITNYHLIDQNHHQKKPPFGKISESVKVSGYLYQIHWEILYQYTLIIKKAQLKPASPVLLPYAVYVSLLVSQQIKKLGIVLWSKNQWKFYYFEDAILLHHFSLKENLNFFIKKIAQKFQYGEKDVEKYLFKFLDLNPSPDKNMSTFLEIHNKHLSNLGKEIYKLTDKYFNYVTDQMFFMLQEKFKLNAEKITFYLVGDATDITNIQTYLQSVRKLALWKVKQNIFTGIIDYRDTFLIGNAYQQHLENKLLYNQNKE